MDIFDLFGGGMFGGNDPRHGRKKKGEDVTFPLKVQLDEIYSGTSKKLRLTKNILCSACKGKGGKNGAEATCTGCKGQGMRMTIRQVGPGMIQQIPSKCTQCAGTGSQIAEADKCQTCSGVRTIKEKKTLEVFVTKGSVDCNTHACTAPLCVLCTRSLVSLVVSVSVCSMRHGERITFRGEADEAPNVITGDVVVVLQVAEHPVFRRDGPNLFVKRSITLIEALTGFSFLLTHLDGRVLKISSEPGMIVKPGQIKCVRDEGMPKAGNPYERGSLYVEMDVIFPTPQQLDEKTMRALSAVLPRPAKAADLKSTPPPKGDGTGELQPRADHPNLLDVYEVSLTAVDMHAERRQHAEMERQESEEYDEDEEGHAHGHAHGRGRPQAGCQQQ